MFLNRDLPYTISNTPVNTPHEHTIKRITIISDAWQPQINGVVRTLTEVQNHLHQKGLEVDIIGPDRFKNFACPTYPEIRLALDSIYKLEHAILTHQPDAIHIATEGPLGWAARHLMRRWKLPFTTSFHTRFPEYLNARFPIPKFLTYSALCRFHCFAKSTLVPTQSIYKELSLYGFHNLKVWTRGVDLQTFSPQYRKKLNLKGPIHLYVGRIAIEKNLDAFLSLDLEGSKLVVGEGPYLDELKRKYPQVHFLGKKTGKELSEIYASSDVFVFPSRSDTFGVVIIEALASGLPVAAFPAPGPTDILRPSVGVVMEDLKLAIKHCYKIPRSNCTVFAKQFNWNNCADIFYENLCKLPDYHWG